MSGDRIEQAVQRIEAALSRIAIVADREPPVQDAGPQHDELLAAVAAQLVELDTLISEMER